MRRVRVTTVASSVVALGAVPVFLTGAMGVQIRAEFGLGPAGFGIMLSAFHVSSALASPALGRVAESRPAMSMRWAVTLTLVSLVGIALGGRSPVLYAGFLIGTGLGFALAQTSTNLFITRTVPASNRATVLGIKHAAIPLAALLAGLAVPTVAVTIGWRWAFAIAAGGATLLWARLPKSFTGFSNPPAKDGGGGIGNYSGHGQQFCPWRFLGLFRSRNGHRRGFCRILTVRRRCFSNCHESHVGMVSRSPFNPGLRWHSVASDCW
ncbi:MAG: MFS transporter [Actinomycetia bacterium]|nr:MFS transporter [Actinomycetes bacterium]